MGVDTCTGSYCFDPALTEWNTGSKQEMPVPRFALSASGVGLARDRKGRAPLQGDPSETPPRHGLHGQTRNQSRKALQRARRHTPDLVPVCLTHGAAAPGRFESHLQELGTAAWGSLDHAARDTAGASCQAERMILHVRQDVARPWLLRSDVRRKTVVSCPSRSWCALCRHSGWSRRPFAPWRACRSVPRIVIRRGGGLRLYLRGRVRSSPVCAAFPASERRSVPS